MSKIDEIDQELEELKKQQRAERRALVAKRKAIEDERRSYIAAHIANALGEFQPSTYRTLHDAAVAAYADDEQVEPIKTPDEWAAIIAEQSAEPGDQPDEESDNETDEPEDDDESESGNPANGNPEQNDIPGEPVEPVAMTNGNDGGWGQN